MNHSVKIRRQALHQTHHHYYLNISVEAANLSDWRIESNRIETFFCPNWNALVYASVGGFGARCIMYANWIAPNSRSVRARRSTKVVLRRRDADIHAARRSTAESPRRAGDCSPARRGGVD